MDAVCNYRAHFVDLNPLRAANRLPVVLYGNLAKLATRTGGVADRYGG